MAIRGNEGKDAKKIPKIKLKEYYNVLAVCALKGRVRNVGLISSSALTYLAYDKSFK